MPWTAWPPCLKERGFDGYFLEIGGELRHRRPQTRLPVLAGRARSARFRSLRYLCRGRQSRRKLRHRRLGQLSKLFRTRRRTLVPPDRSAQRPPGAARTRGCLRHRPVRRKGGRPGHGLHGTRTWPKAALSPSATDQPDSPDLRRRCQAAGATTPAKDSISIWIGNRNLHKRIVKTISDPGKICITIDNSENMSIIYDQSQIMDCMS